MKIQTKCSPLLLTLVAVALLANRVATESTATTGPTTPAAIMSATSAASTSAPDEVGNCTQPTKVQNQFNVSGLEGYDLVSHSDYLSNSASKHGPNLVCSWLLRKQDSSELLLIKIVSLQLETASECEFDSLKFHYIDYNSSLVRNISFCSAAQNSILMSRSDVNVTFRTDSSVNHRGFHIRWASVNDSVAQWINVEAQSSTSSGCSVKEPLDLITMTDISAMGGRILSHDLFGSFLTSEHRYKNNMNCQWEIELIGNYTLIWIEFLQLESGRGPLIGRQCPYDNLTLAFTNAISGANESLTFCSVVIDRMFLAKSAVHVKFMSDSSVESRGFHIKWLHLNDLQANRLQLSWNMFANASRTECTRLEPLANLTLEGVGNYSGGRLVSHPEYLTTVNSTYHPNMNCSWTITPPSNATLIHLKIVTIDLEVATGNSYACRYDNLTLTFRNAITNRWEQRVACSSLHSVKFTSSATVTIQFTTDHSVAKRGFHLEWYYIPRFDIGRLPQIEELQPFNCPEVNEDMGVLNVINYQPNMHCVWLWTVGAAEEMQFTIGRLQLDSRDLAVPGSRCLTARDKLSFEFFDSAGAPTKVHYCGRQHHTVFTAFTGTVLATFTSDSTDEGRGFIFLYRKVQKISRVSDCSDMQQINSHQYLLTGRLQPNTARICKWTLEPKDENHIIKIAMKKFESLSSVRPYPSLQTRYQWHGDYRHRYRQSECMNKLTIVANRTISTGNLLRAASMLYTDDSATVTNVLNNTVRQSMVICPSRFVYPDSLLSIGPVLLQIESTAVSPGLSYEIRIDHWPVAFPQSPTLCPKRTVVGTKQILIEKRQMSRLVSVKQLEVASPQDCRTSIVFDKQPMPPMPYGWFQRENKLRLSVNCTRSSGKIYIVADGSVSVINCRSIVQMNWTQQGAPVTLEAEDTGGFRILLDQVKWISDGSYKCPLYSPTDQGSWIATLPFFLNYQFRHGYYGQEMFYCEFLIPSTPNKDLILQVLLPLGSYDSQEAFCRELSDMASQPRLSLILTQPNGAETVMQLCDHDKSGTLSIQDRIRVSSGYSVTVDLIASLIFREAPMNRNNRTAIQADGLNAVIMAYQVDECQQINKQMWKTSSDNKAVQSTITVEPNNTQTDCSIQLGAEIAFQVANENHISTSIEGNGECVSLQLTVSKFAIACGQNDQMILKMSYHDSLVGSVVHKQKKLCGTSSIFTMSIVRESARDTGVTLYYNAVRSGFVATFSISPCQSSMDTVPVLVDELVDVKQTAGGTTGLAVAILFLSLCILCVVLFHFRAEIADRSRAFINRARGSHRLSYTPGGDGVALINDS